MHTRRYNYGNVSVGMLTDISMYVLCRCMCMRVDLYVHMNMNVQLCRYVRVYNVFLCTI